jgi:phage-related protein
MPESRPMTSIGRACHELRVQDPKSRVTWRIIYRIDRDAIVIAEIFAKQTQRTPDEVIGRCRQRLRKYDEDRRSQ